jgi:hypothetical protein
MTSRTIEDAPASPPTSSKEYARWLPFLLSANRLITRRQSFSLAKSFLSWKSISLEPYPRRPTFCEMLRSMRICIDHLQRISQLQIKRDAFCLWKLIPSQPMLRDLASTSREDESTHNHLSTPHPVPLNTHGTLENETTPLLEGLTPNIPGLTPLTPLTPQTDSRVIQRLRFSEVVDISVLEPIQDPEEDLTILGPLPIETLPLFKANEVVYLVRILFHSLILHRASSGIC